MSLPSTLNSLPFSQMAMEPSLISFSKRVAFWHHLWRNRRVQQRGAADVRQDYQRLANLQLIEPSGWVKSGQILWGHSEPLRN